MSAGSGDIGRMIRRNLQGLKAYQPIEPPEIIGQRAGVSEVIKLDGNENPYGCSPAVRQFLADYPRYHIYPDPEQREVRKALSAYVGIDPQHVVAGAGSDELIDLILRLFIEPGDEVINCPPTFGMYPFCTDICGGNIVDVPRDKSYAVDISGVKKAVSDNTKVIFVTSPNNPSGNLTPASDIMELLETGRVVVVDEAYYEFSGVTMAPHITEHDNLIVLRSLSKWAGLAGLRIGYGIFATRLAEKLLTIKQPYNINIAAQVALLASLADIDYLRGTVDKILSERERLFEKLSALDWLKPFPTQSNFILCEVTKGNAKTIHDMLQKRGIFIRYFDSQRLRNSLRISVGKPEHTDALITALKDIAHRTSERG